MKEPAQRCWCEVDLQAVTRNLREIRRRIGPGPKIMGLVKADAYGHGMIPLARHFEKNDCQMLGCAHLQEGIALRRAGIRLPILLLSAPLTSEIEGIFKNHLSATVSSLTEARLWAKLAVQYKRRVSLHLKINTGMNRLGVAPSEFKALLAFLQKQPGLQLDGVYSHYASADSDAAFTQRQYQLFTSLAPSGVPRHLSNTAALLNFPALTGDIVRPGIALYGLSPVPSQQAHFHPALSWKSRVTFVKKIGAGERLSYGGTYRCHKPLRIATVAVGYGDGLFRTLSNKGEVLIGGRRCRILGRVTMDQILVDVSRVTGVRNGSEVVLLGRQGREKILATEMARLAGTISYEILCHITDRVPRLYREGAGK